MPAVILDTDFFSSFLKIERCGLIRSFDQVKQAIIPTAVYRELAQTDLLTRLLTIRWITVLPVEPPSDEPLLQNPTLQGHEKHPTETVGTSQPITGTGIVMIVIARGM